MLSKDCRSSATPLHVLVDDDKVARMVWEFEANQRGVRYRIFSSPFDFLERMREFPEDTKFYFDFDLQVTLNGIHLAKRVKATRNAKVYLVTGHHPEEFEEYVEAGIIEGVHDKGFVDQPFRS